MVTLYTCVIVLCSHLFTSAIALVHSPSLLDLPFLFSVRHLVMS